jgi:hypothetical protein
MVAPVSRQKHPCFKNRTYEKLESRRPERREGSP